MATLATLSGMVERYTQCDRAAIRVADEMDAARNASGKAGDPRSIGGDDIFVEAVPRRPSAVAMEIGRQHQDSGSSCARSAVHCPPVLPLECRQMTVA